MLPFLASLVLQSSTVALDRHVASVDSVIAELARKSGRPLAIRREMRDEALFVALDPRPVEELLKLLAQATNAEWTEEAGVLRLGRSASLVRRQEAFERATFGAEWKTRLDSALLGYETPWGERFDPANALIRSIGEVKDGPNAYSRIQARIGRAAPLGRLLARAARALDPLEIATIPPGETVRYASQPRRFQRPLKGLDAAAVQAYANEARRLEDAVADLSDEARQNLRLYTGDLPKATLPADTRLLLTVAPNPNGATQLVLQSFDAQGVRTARAGLVVPPLPRSVPPELPDERRWGSTPVSLRPLPSAFDPGVEPLDPILGEPVELVRQAVGGEAIWALPDEAGPTVRNAVGKKATLGRIAQALGESIRFERCPGLLVGSARRPVQASLDKARREPMAALLRTPAGQGLGLGSILDYLAAQNPRLSVPGLEWQVLGGLDEGRLGGTSLWEVTHENDRKLVRVLGFLSAAQREALFAGGQISFAALSPQGREAMEDATFRGAVSFDRPGRVSDPTVWSDALPAEGAIRLQDRTSELRVAYLEEGRWESCNPETLGAARAGAEVGTQLAVPGRADLRVVSGSRLRWSVAYDFLPGASLRASLSGSTFDGSAVSSDALPPAHLAAFRKGYAGYKAGD